MVVGLFFNGFKSMSGEKFPSFIPNWLVYMNFAVIFNEHSFVSVISLNFPTMREPADSECVFANRRELKVSS